MATPISWASIHRLVPNQEAPLLLVDELRNMHETISVDTLE
jgi:hypothetical protein